MIAALATRKCVPLRISSGCSTALQCFLTLPSCARSAQVQRAELWVNGCGHGIVKLYFGIHGFLVESCVSSTELDAP